MPRSFALYLQDTLEAGREIETFTANKSLDDSIADRQLRLAVERPFEIIGEALSQSQIYYPEREPVTSAQRKVYLPPFLAEVSTLVAQETGVDVPREGLEP